jgi:hypothetical protein
VFGYFLACELVGLVTTGVIHGCGCRETIEN